MQLYNFLLFVFDKNLISNTNGLEVFYSVFEEVGHNFDLVEKEKWEAKAHELATSTTWKVKEENEEIARKEFWKKMKCEKAKKEKEDARWKKIDEVQSKRWEEMWWKEEEIRKAREETKAALEKASKSPTWKAELKGASPLWKP